MRYQRELGTWISAAVSSDRAASGEVRNAATVVATTVVTATTIAGMPNRMMCASDSTSLVVRATRSPVPARSTTDSGSRTDEVMKSSRSRAKIRSDSTNDALRATQVSSGLQQDRGDEQADELVDPGQAAAAGGDLLHDLADDPRADEGEQGRDDVPPEHARQRAAVVAHEHLGVLEHGLARGDRQGAGGVVGATEQR